MTNTFEQFTDATGRAVAVYHLPERGIYCEVSKAPGERTFKVEAEYMRDGRSHGWATRFVNGSTAFGLADAFVSLELNVNREG